MVRTYAQEELRLLDQLEAGLIVADATGDVVAWNAAAERILGLPAGEAIGRSWSELVTIVHGGITTVREVLTAAALPGGWHGPAEVRVTGGKSARIHIHLQRVREPSLAAGRGYMAVFWGTDAGLEAEAALSSFAVAAGRARTRREVAEATLERLCEATTADMGVVLSIDDGAPVVDAYRGMSEETIAGLRGGSSLPAILARLDTPGSKLTFDAVHTGEAPWPALPLEREGLASGFMTGLRVRGELIGFLALGSRNPAWPHPSDDVILQASAQVANALENARLMERLERGLAEEKQLTTQLEALVGLTQLPQGDITEQTLAKFLLRRIVLALDARAGFVVRPTEAGRFRIVATHYGEDDMSDPATRKRAILDLEGRPVESFYFWRRLAEGSGPFYIRLDATTVDQSVVTSLRDEGYRSYAAFPLRESGELIGAFVCHFARNEDEGVPVDSRTLEAVGRILEIAYGNIRLGEGLAVALEHERRLGAEIHALQALTLLGAASDDLVQLAGETISSVMAATGASGGGYILAGSTGHLEPIVWSGIPASTGPASSRGDGRRWREFEHLQERERVCVCQPRRARPEPAQATLPLRLDGRLAGAIQLVWATRPAPEALDLHFLEPISHIASISLANFRLRAELLERAAAQRGLSQRLDALDELTRIGEESGSFEELAHRTVNLVREALAATGVCYLLFEPGRHFETQAVAGETGVFRLWLRGVPVEDAPGGGQLASGGNSVLADFGPNQVSEGLLPLARSSGFRSFAAIPIRTGEELAGALLCFFDRPAADLSIDEAALDSVARIAGIALANFRLRERLVSSEERYRTLFEESPEAVFVCALDGTVLDVNDAAVRLYRMKRGEILGRDIGRLTTADEHELERRRQIVWAQGRGTFDDRGRRPDGTEFPIEIEIRVVELGSERRFLLLVRDLSDQERLQRELLQAQKMEALGQLVSGVAHELNNPLAAIIGFSQVMRSDPRLPDDIRHDANLLVQEADRTKRIVQNLLDFARARPPERTPTSIATLVSSVFELQSYALTTNGIQVSLDIPEDLPTVDLDRAQLQQVVLNLTINAIQAIQAADRAAASRISVTARLVRSDAEVAPPRRSARGQAGIDLDGGDGGSAAADTAAAEPDRVRVTITDNGSGVAEDARARLFDPFFTTRRPGEGTGLGLSVSFGIVAAHGGRLWYDPGPDGVGSSFVIELPVRARVQDEPRLVAPLGPVRAAAPAAPLAAPAAAPVAAPAAPRRAAPAPRPVPASPAYGPATGPAAGRPRILVLDDEASIRAFLRKALAIAGMEGTTFQDGSQALEAVRDAAFDVMLVDHRMARMSGTEFYEAAVRFRPEVARRAVFMSGDVLDPDLRGFAMQRGIRLLAKPFDIDAVIRVVKDALACEGTLGSSTEAE